MVTTRHLAVVAEAEQLAVDSSLVLRLEQHSTQSEIHYHLLAEESPFQTADESYQVVSRNLADCMNRLQPAVIFQQLEQDTVHSSDC